MVPETEILFCTALLAASYSVDVLGGGPMGPAASGGRACAPPAGGAAGEAGIVSGAMGAVLFEPLPSGSIRGLRAGRPMEPSMATVYAVGDVMKTVVWAVPLIGWDEPSRAAQTNGTQESDQASYPILCAVLCCAADPCC